MSKWTRIPTIRLGCSSWCTTSSSQLMTSVVSSIRSTGFRGRGESMRPTTPIIDPRTFQDLVDEAKRRIPQYCPEWTDHNVADPGITLIELFAWMVDLLLYRLNKVPDRDYLKFLELIGAHPHPAVPASAELTFWLTAPQRETKLIPRGTEVATRQTETRPAVTFTTDSLLRIRVPQLRYWVLARSRPSGGTTGDAYEDVSNRLTWE